jgi:hypothetical protein
MASIQPPDEESMAVRLSLATVAIAAAALASYLVFLMFQ